MLIEHAKPEYRLCVERPHIPSRYGKRDLKHAEKGLRETVEHYEQLGMPVVEAWIETRSVTEWRRMDE